MRVRNPVLSRPHLRAVLSAAAVFMLWLCPGAPRTIDAQSDPVSLVRAYWSERDDSARAALAQRIASHPDYRPSRLREWLHGGVPFEDLAPGPRTIDRRVGAGRVPPGDARAAGGLPPRSGVAPRLRVAPVGRACGPVGGAGAAHAGHAGPRVRHRLARVPAELHRRQAAVRRRACGDPRCRRAARARGREPRLCLRVLEGRVRGLVRHRLLCRPFRRHRRAGGGVRRRPGPGWVLEAAGAERRPCAGAQRLGRPRSARRPRPRGEARRHVCRVEPLVRPRVEGPRAAHHQHRGAGRGSLPASAAHGCRPRDARSAPRGGPGARQPHVPAPAPVVELLAGGPLLGRRFLGRAVARACCRASQASPTRRCSRGRSSPCWAA